MITFIIPTFMNPTGLRDTIASLLSIGTEDTRIIVLFDKNDNSIGLGVSICTHAAVAKQVRYFVFETPSLTARVNFAVQVARTPFLCVVNDDILLGKSNSPIDTLISAALVDCSDQIVALYLCNMTENDNGYRFPIVSKRFTDLTGYLYHPICATQLICERWIGSIFDTLQRIIMIPGFPFVSNVDYPTNITYNTDVSAEAEFLFQKTVKVRTDTARMLSKFIVKE